MSDNQYSAKQQMERLHRKYRQTPPLSEDSAFLQQRVQPAPLVDERALLDECQQTLDEYALRQQRLDAYRRQHGL